MVLLASIFHAPSPETANDPGKNLAIVPAAPIYKFRDSHLPLFPLT